MIERFYECDDGGCALVERVRARPRCEQLGGDELYVLVLSLNCGADPHDNMLDEGLREGTAIHQNRRVDLHTRASASLSPRPAFLGCQAARDAVGLSGTPAGTQTSVRSRAKSTAPKWQSGIRSARFHPALLPRGELTYMQDMSGRVIQASPRDQLGLKSSMLSTCGITGPGRSVRQSAAALQRPPELTALGNPAEPTNRRAARSTCFNGGSWC